MPRILIVEDNELNRDVLSRRLQRHGFDVVTAPDGREGLRMAERERPDVILMDLGLPEIDGWECVRRLRAAEPTRAIPVIALTAHAMAGDRERALAAGCSDFDVKPINFAALLDKLTSLVSPEH
jgi:two-component system cell cycle response regulator DivK